ncbi:MAG: hypothetical protein R3F56_08005 [Planctomycetota bacterium]
MRNPAATSRGPAATSSPALRLLAIASIALGSYVAVTAVLSVVGHYQPLPYRDQWGTVAEVRDLYLGRFHPDRFFWQHNEHRLAVPRLFFYLDALLARERGMVLLGVTLLEQVAHVALLVGLLRWGGERRPAVLVAVAGALLAFQFSAVQQENFSEPFQLQFPLVYLAATAGFAAAARAPFSRRGRTLVAAAIAASGIASFSMANGLGVWPLALSLAFFVPLPWMARLAIAGAGAATIAFYLTGLGWLQPYASVDHGIPTVGFRRPAASATFFASFFGHPVRTPNGWQRPYLAIVVGVLSLGLAAVLAWRSWWRGEGRERAVRRALVCAGAFVLCAALLTTYGRATDQLLHELSSRYATPALLFWSMLLVTAVLSERGAVRVATLGLCGGLALSVAVSQQALHRRDAVHRREIRRAAIGPLVGVTDLDRLRPYLTSDPDGNVRDGLGFLREHRLSLFHAGDWPLRGRPLDVVGTPAGTCVAAIDTLEVCHESGWGFRASGWALEETEALPPQRLLFTDDHDVLIGYGEPDTRCPEVEAKSPRIRGHAIGFVGYGVASSSRGVVRLYMQAADGRVFRFPGELRIAGVELVEARGQPLAAPMQARGDVRHAHLDDVTGAGLDVVVSSVRGQGGCTFGPFVWAEGDLDLAVPVTTGDCGLGMTVALVDGTTGVPVSILRPPTMHGTWCLWRCRLPDGLRGRPLYVGTVDAGIHDGQQVGIGRPEWIPAAR